MGSFFQDLRYGARMLMKKPGLSLIAILTLALGIGTNTVIFSLAQASLQRPLATDPLIFAGVAVVLSLAALLAC